MSKVLDNLKGLFGAKKLTAEDKLKIIRSYFNEVYITPDAVGFYTMVVRSGGHRPTEMLSRGDTHSQVIDDVFDKLNYKIDIQCHLLTPGL